LDEGNRQAYCTVTIAVAEWTTVPLVPVTVIVVLAFGVLLFVETVSVEVPEPATDAGLNVALARVGKPVVESVTVPENPAPPVIVTV